MNLLKIMTKSIFVSDEHNKISWACIIAIHIIIAVKCGTRIRTLGQGTNDRIVKLCVLHFSCKYPDSKIHGAKWGPSGANRIQVGPMLAPWTLLYGYILCRSSIAYSTCRNNNKQILHHWFCKEKSPSQAPMIRTAFPCHDVIMPHVPLIQCAIEQFSLVLNVNVYTLLMSKFTSSNSTVVVQFWTGMTARAQGAYKMALVCTRGS